MIVPMIQSRSPSAKPCLRGKPPALSLPYTSSQGMKSRRVERSRARGDPPSGPGLEARSRGILEDETNESSG